MGALSLKDVPPMVLRARAEGQLYRGRTKTCVK
jgi:hypothetical protein